MCLQELDALQAELTHLLKESSEAAVLQQRDFLKKQCTELLGETRAQAIAQLDAVSSVGVKVDEAVTVKKIVELVQGSLFGITGVALRLSLSLSF